MPDYGDIEGLPPVTLDPVPDLASLPWPWDQPALAAPGSAVIPGAVDVAPAVPALPLGEPALAPPTAAAAPLAATAEPPPAMQPGLGIPQATLDALVPAADVSPIPSAAPAIAPPGPSPELAAAPPVVAAPAVEQPLTPTAGATAFGEPPGAPADLAGFAPAPIGEPGLPPAPDPFAPPAFLPMPIEPVTGQLEPAGMPPESTLAGFAGAPLTPEQRYAVTAAEYQRDPNKLLDRLEQPGALDADTQRYLDEFAARDPAGAAVMQQRLRDAGTMHAAAERARVAKENYDTQMANIERLKAARAVATRKLAEIDAESTKIAETKIGYHPSTFQRIAGIIAAVVGGLYQGKTGSARNPGLDALNDVINRDLQEQRDNLTNRRDVLQQRRSALGELTARNNDEYQADETMRLAALKLADEQLAQEQLKYAADGTRGLNLAALRTGLTAQMAANKEAHDAKLEERALKVSKDIREQEQAAEVVRHNKAGEAKDWATEARLATADKADHTVWTPEQLKALNTVDGRVPPVPPIAMTQKDYSSWLGTQKEAEQFATAARSNNPNERARELAVSGVVDNTGQPVLFADSNIKAVRDGKEYAEETVRIADDLVRIMKQDGWQSDLVKSAEWRKAQQNYNALIIKQKEADKLGVLTGPDVGIVTKEIGTTDPTEVRSKDAIDALLHFRHNVVESLNTKVRTQAALPEGRTIKRWDPPLNLEPAPKSEEQAALERLKTKPDVSRDEARAQGGHDWLAVHPEFPRNALGQVELTDPAVRSGWLAAQQEAEDQRREVTPQQRRDINDLVHRGTSGDLATRARVLEHLAGLATDGPTARIRQLAREAAAEVRINTERPAADPVDPAMRDAQEAADRARARLGGQ